MSDPEAGDGRAPLPLPDPDGYFFPAGSGSRHQIFPGVEIRTTAGKGLMLSVVHFEPGSVVAEHAHPHEQMGILIEGHLEFTVGGVTRRLGPGDLCESPAASSTASAPSTARPSRSTCSTRSEKTICNSVQLAVREEPISLDAGYPFG